MFKRIKGFYQYNQEDCGAACLATVLNFHNIRTTISVLRNEMSYDKNGANILSIIEIAKKYGLEAEAYEGNFEQLQEQIEQDQFKYPMIVHVERENIRSEEHTSELQSRGHLVCRLLLEKKKKKNLW